MLQDRSAIDFWERRARDGGWRIPVPLAPGAEDLALFAARIRSGGTGFGRRRALVLGITPALVTLPWPESIELLAVDWSRAVISESWPAAQAPAGAWPVCGDWRGLPLADRSCDVVVGDGCYAALACAGDAERMTREVHRVLRPGGLFCLRHFARPEAGERVDALFEELLEKGLAMDAFRFRLAMALHGDAGEGVMLDAVWQAFRARIPDPRAAASRHGWSEGELVRWERWRGARVRYFFATLSELERLRAGRFELVELSWPSYVMGERCPRLVMRAL